MEEIRYVAKFIIRNEIKKVSGWDAFDILNKVVDVQDVIEEARVCGTESDFVQAQMLYEWNYINFDSPGDMHRFDSFDFEFSFGTYSCIEWSAI